MSPSTVAGEGDFYYVKGTLIETTFFIYKDENWRT